jgi:hypothetical protein
MRSIRLTRTGWEGGKRIVALLTSYRVRSSLNADEIRQRQLDADRQIGQIRPLVIAQWDAALRCRP